MTQTALTSERQFPQRCPECGKVAVHPEVISYNAHVKHDGSLYELSIPRLHVNKCQSCGEVLFDNKTDDEISQALRDRLKLLSPQEIRERIHSLGLTQKEFAEGIRAAPETISRWLSGTHIQSGSSDMLMRLFFEREETRANQQGSGEPLRQPPVAQVQANPGS